MICVIKSVWIVPFLWSISFYRLLFWFIIILIATLIGLISLRYNIFRVVLVRSFVNSIDFVLLWFIVIIVKSSCYKFLIIRWPPFSWLLISIFDWCSINFLWCVVVPFVIRFSSSISIIEKLVVFWFWNTPINISKTITTITFF